MKTRFMIAFIVVLVLAGGATADAAVSFQMGTKNFYLSAGDYDYLPYVYANNPGYSPPQIDFRQMMSQYGQWVNAAPFGDCWQPYAVSGWRPYLYGHWLYTEYGPYWEGYEPWAWVGYHYGAWIWDADYGWLWVPGYDWEPCRVAWARGYLTIGWMPLPPDGYDYERGSLEYIGPVNQFAYTDDDFGVEFGPDSYSYGGPYYNPQFRDMYYNTSYLDISVDLWVFIDDDNFDQDDYANYELGPDYTRYAFDQKVVRISSQPINMTVLQAVVQQPIQQVPVDVRNLRTNKGAIRVVVPAGAAPIERIRQHSSDVMRQVIAPAFAGQKQQFKGHASKIQVPVGRIFQQEKVQPRVETPSREQVINFGREAQQNRAQQRAQNMEAARQRTENLKSQGRMMEPGTMPMMQPRRAPESQPRSEPMMEPAREPAKEPSKEPGMEPGKEKGRGGR